MTTLTTTNNLQTKGLGSLFPGNTSYIIKNKDDSSDAVVDEMRSLLVPDQVIDDLRTYLCSVED